MMRPHHHRRLALFNSIQRPHPRLPSRLVQHLRHPHVHVVVHDIPRHDQPQRRHVQERRRVRVAVARVDGLERVALERERLVLVRQRLRHDLERGVGDLPREQPLPECAHRRALLRAHVVDRGASGDGAHAGEARDEVAEVEPVVAVAVRDVDGGEFLGGAERVFDPVAQRDALVVGEERVDEDGGCGAQDEGYDGGLPEADRAVGEALGGRDCGGVKEVGAEGGRHCRGWGG